MSSFLKLKLVLSSIIIFELIKLLLISLIFLENENSRSLTASKNCSLYCKQTFSTSPTLFLKICISSILLSDNYYACFTKWLFWKLFSPSKLRNSAGDFNILFYLWFKNMFFKFMISFSVSSNLSYQSLLVIVLFFYSRFCIIYSVINLVLFSDIYEENYLLF